MNSFLERTFPKEFENITDFKLSIDPQQIIYPDLICNAAQTAGRLKGFHHDYGRDLFRQEVYKIGRYQELPREVYQGDVYISGGWVGTKTFFPAAWDVETLISKIVEAASNCESDAYFDRPSNTIILQGSTAEGIELFFSVAADGKIKTVYPVSLSSKTFNPEIRTKGNRNNSFRSTFYGNSLVYRMLRFEPTSLFGKADSWNKIIDAPRDVVSSGNDVMMFRHNTMICVKLIDEEPIIEEKDWCMPLESARRFGQQMERLLADRPTKFAVYWHHDGSPTLEWDAADCQEVAASSPTTHTSTDNPFNNDINQKEIDPCNNKENWSDNKIVLVVLAIIFLMTTQSKTLLFWNFLTQMYQRTGAQHRGSQ